MEHCEEDAIAAYRELGEAGARSIVLLGFSLGTGVAGAVASRMDVEGAGVVRRIFDAARGRGMAMGFPRWLTRMVPDAWDYGSSSGRAGMPVLVVHSDVDGLFPMAMAKQVAEACGQRGELIVVSGLTHNAPIFAPTEDYWGPVAEWVKRR